MPCNPPGGDPRDTGHIGSARYDAGLEVLSAARRPRLAAGQDEL